MPFIITGKGPDGLRSVTRISPASAIVLAMNWHEEGVQGIQITPPGRAPRCFMTFQAQHYGLMRPASEPHQTPTRPCSP